MAGGRHGRSDAPSHHILYFAPTDISALATLRQRKQKEPLPGWVVAPKLNYMSIARARLGLEGLLDGDSAGDGGTDHGLTEEYRSGRSAVLRIGQCILRLAAPLL